jgi:hypothetical protein
MTLMICELGGSLFSFIFFCSPLINFTSGRLTTATKSRQLAKRRKSDGGSSF